MSRRVLSVLSCAGFFAPALAFSQPASAVPDAQARIAALEQALKATQAAAASAQSAGDNAWMLVCAALVLLMTGPGL
ncbi:MAG: hypothetical protein ACLGSH_03505, partial [Acidobacteriota bacterium]